MYNYEFSFRIKSKIKEHLSMQFFLYSILTIYENNFNITISKS